MPIPLNYQVQYGLLWSPIQVTHPSNGKVVNRPRPQFLIERDMYLRRGIEITKKALSKAGHFMKLGSCLLAHPKAAVPFQWDPNSVKMAHAYVEEGDVGFVGHAGSKKSYDLAAFGIVDFIADPENTGVVYTSTTLKESRLRVWGHVERLWQDMCATPGIDTEENTPGKLVSSQGLIRSTFGGRKDDQRGLVLIAGSLAESKSGVQKMKGFHPPRLRVMLDELSDLSLEILEAAESNLKNCPDPKLCAALNSRDMLDAGGNFCEPEGDWENTPVHLMSEWKTKKGRKILRFSADQSPNVLLGRKYRDAEITREELQAGLWGGLLTLEQYERAKDDLGETSHRFKQQYLAIWPTDGLKDALYSLDMIIRSGAKHPAKWIDEPVWIASLDPSFSHGGDRCPVHKMRYGKAKIGDVVLNTLEYHSTYYADDNLDTTKDKKEQVVNNTCDFLDQPDSYIKQKHFALDVTGEGGYLAALFAIKRGMGFHKVSFAGSPTDRAVSAADKSPDSGDKKDIKPTKPPTGKDKFENRVSELWGIGIEFMRAGQFRNMPEKILSQLTKRTCKDSIRKKLQVTPKEEMGHSPDEADAFFIGVDLCRERFGFFSGEKAKAIPRESSELIVKDQHGNALFDLAPLQKTKQGSFKSMLKKFSFYH